VTPRRSHGLEPATRLMFTRIMIGLARTLRDEELTVAQVAALHLIDQEGRLRLNQVAEALSMSPSAASRMVDSLVQRGLVARTEDPDDRRARALALTGNARDLLARMDADRVTQILEAVRLIPSSLSGRMAGAVIRALGKVEKRRN
jgi:DNA-binding MarR family transcriptional regulator